MLKQSTSQLSPKELFAKAFLDLKKDVETEDRNSCANELEISKVTVNRYLNGHIYDTVTADKIFTYLKKRIEKRTRTVMKSSF